MEIKFKGHSCFTVKSESGIQVVTDPFSESIALKTPNLQGRIVTVSHDNENHNNVSIVKDNPTVLDWPGEYEIEGIAVAGIAANDEKTGEENIIFKFIIDRIRVCHLGDFNQKLTNDLLDKIGNVDVLFIPVGGQNSLDASKAKEIIEEIDPRIIIPMHYQLNGNNLELGTLQDFLRKMGKPEIEAKKELKITRSQLPSEESEIVVLEID